VLEGVMRVERDKHEHMSGSSFGSAVVSAEDKDGTINDDRASDRMLKRCIEAEYTARYTCRHAFAFVCASVAKVIGFSEAHSLVRVCTCTNARTYMHDYAHIEYVCTEIQHAYDMETDDAPISVVCINECACKQEHSRKHHSPAVNVGMNSY
jgi:hypothetical protein